MVTVNVVDDSSKGVDEVLDVVVDSQKMYVISNSIAIVDSKFDEMIFPGHGWITTLGWILVWDKVLS